MLVDHRNQIERQRSITPTPLEQLDQRLLNKWIAYDRAAECLTLARVVSSLEKRSMQHPACVDGVVNARSINHMIHQRLEAVLGLADRPRGRSVEVNLGSRKRTSAQLVFQTPERNPIYAAIRQQARYKKDCNARCSRRRVDRPSPDQKIFVRVRAKPLLAGNRPRAVGIRAGLSFHRADIRTRARFGDELRSGDRRIG